MNLTQIWDDENALLLMQCSTEKENALLLNEGALNPKPKKLKKVDLNVWYLYNDASNHMTGQPLKFREWDEGITGLVESGDHWVRYEGN